MRRKFILPVCICVFCSCSATKGIITDRFARQNNQKIQRANKSSIDGYQSLTSLQYIDRFKTIAIQEMNLYNIPASITLAQGLFESGSGNGELAKVANNHFGIKCTSDWQGKGYYKDDDHTNDCFRVYDKPEDSFRDHSLFLKRKNYAKLFDLDKTDYKGWAYGLKKAGYATNPNYPTLLINIIEKYSLYQYDTPDGRLTSPKVADTTVSSRVVTPPTVTPPVIAPPTVTPQVVTPQAVITPAEKDTTTNADSTQQQVSPDKFYTIKQGDTLYNISKRFGLTVDELKGLNNLTDNTIKIGQKLQVVK